MTILKQLLEGERQADLTYTPYKVKGIVDRVIVELKGNDSANFTKLATEYAKINAAIEKLDVKKKALNKDLRGQVEAIFDAEDAVLTRVVDTVSFTITLSKEAKKESKPVVDFEKIAHALAELIPNELQAKVDEIAKLYTSIQETNPKAPGVSVKPKVTEGQELSEGLLSAIAAKIKKFTDRFKKWKADFDAELDGLKDLLHQDMH